MRTREGSRKTTHFRVRIGNESNFLQPLFFSLTCDKYVIINGRVLGGTSLGWGYEKQFSGTYREKDEIPKSDKREDLWMWQK